MRKKSKKTGTLANLYANEIRVKLQEQGVYLDIFEPIGSAHDESSQYGLLVCVPAEEFDPLGRDLSEDIQKVYGGIPSNAESIASSLSDSRQLKRDIVAKELGLLQEAKVKGMGIMNKVSPRGGFVVFDLSNEEKQLKDAFAMAIKQGARFPELDGPYTDRRSQIDVFTFYG